MEATARPMSPDASDLSPVSLFGDIRLLKLRFHVAMVRHGRQRLPPYLGSAWRGLIGWSLKRLSCSRDLNAACGQCVGRGHCPYFLLFESKSILPGCDESPRGYIFYPPPNDGGRALEQLDVTLMGPYTRYVPLLIKAMAAGRQVGLGASRVPYRIAGLEEVRPDGTAAALTAEPGALASLRDGHPLREWLAGGEEADGALWVRLATPVRLRRRGAYLKRMDWPFFFETLARRLESISCTMGGEGPLGNDRWLSLRRLFSASSGIRASLNWMNHARFSSRQKTKVPMGGLVGHVLIDGDPGALLPWFRAGSMVHVGKGAAMGLGRVDLRSAET